MNARPLILLAAGFVALVYAARRLRKAWSASRARSRATRSDWEFSCRLFPIPQCSIQLDDPDSIAWIANRLTGTGRDPNTAVLPLTSARRNGIAHSSRYTKSGIAASLRHYSYFYVSPLVAVVGSVLAISVLSYQARWTVKAIVSRIQELAAASGTDAKGLSASSLMSSSISRFGKRDHTGFALTPSPWKRDIGHSPGATEGPLPLREYSSNDRGSILQPLIPGITVPLSHTLPLLFALFVSQVVHELGHLAVASLHGIPPLRLVAGLYAFLPFAAVVLPNSISNAEPKTLLRVAAAGPYHNFLTYFVLLLVSLMGVHKLFYEDVSTLGVYVTHVSDRSPLKGYLPEHVIIAHLDDVPLATSGHNRSALESTADVWSAYLLAGTGILDELGSLLETWNEHKGWCVPQSAFGDATLPPCPPSTGIRFVRAIPSIEHDAGHDSPPGQEHHCFSAYPTLTEPTVDCALCSSDSVCIRPAAEEGILRIRYAPMTGKSLSEAPKTEQVVLFAGEREAVHRDVRVSTWRPRGGFAVQNIVRWGELVILYIGVLSLALATLNLLPLPRLDGTHILSAVLDLVFTVNPENALVEHELEELEAYEEASLDPPRDGTRRALQKKRWWHRAISWTITGVAVVCVGGGVVLGAL